MDPGALLGLVLLAAMGVGSIVGLFRNVSISAQAGRGLWVVRGQQARTLNVIYLILSIMGIVAVLSMTM
jgi:hypothetical protein